MPKTLSKTYVIHSQHYTESCYKGWFYSSLSPNLGKEEINESRNPIGFMGFPEI